MVAIILFIFVVLSLLSSGLLYSDCVMSGRYAEAERRRHSAAHLSSNDWPPHPTSAANPAQ